jgi:predicted O-methyltransferase YrrM
MNRYKTLTDIISEHSSKQGTLQYRILEIGTYDGTNAIRMCNAVVNCEPYYLGADLFEKAPDYELPKDAPTIETVAKLIESEPILFRLLKGDTRKTLKSLDVNFHFVFIDGGHSVKTIKSDWNNVERIIDENSIVVFDDYYHNREDIGAKKIVDELDKKYKKEFIGPILTFDTDVGDIVVQMVKVTLK